MNKKDVLSIQEFGEETIALARRWESCFPLTYLLNSLIPEIKVIIARSGKRNHAIYSQKSPPYTATGSEPKSSTKTAMKIALKKSLKK